MTECGDCFQLVIVTNLSPQVGIIVKNIGGRRAGLRIQLQTRADLNGVRMFVNGFVRNVFVNMVCERLERLVREWRS